MFRGAIQKIKVAHFYRLWCILGFFQLWFTVLRMYWQPELD